MDVVNNQKTTIYSAVLSQYIGSAVAPLSAKGAAIAPGTHARANAAARTVIVDRDFPEGPRHPPRRANRGVMEAGSLSSRRAKMLSNPPPPRSRHKLSSECWSGSLATRVRVIRRSHRAARRYEHVWRQTRRIRLRWGRHPCADKARALLE